MHPYGSSLVSSPTTALTQVEQTHTSAHTWGYVGKDVCVCVQQKRVVYPEAGVGEGRPVCVPGKNEPGKDPESPRLPLSHTSEG